MRFIKHIFIYNQFICLISGDRMLHTEIPLGRLRGWTSSNHRNGNEFGNLQRRGETSEKKCALEISFRTFEGNLCRPKKDDFFLHILSLIFPNRTLNESLRSSFIIPP